MSNIIYFSVSRATGIVTGGYGTGICSPKEELVDEGKLQ
jgi:hypothetical protein